MIRTGSARDGRAPSVERPRPRRVKGPVLHLAVGAVGDAGGHPLPPPAPPRPLPVTAAPPAPVPPVPPVPVATAKKTCCRSRPRCKRCPVVLMRAARLAESGLTGKDLKKAVKRARAA